MDSLRTYPLEAAAEVCGLNKDTLWRVCDRVGLDPDAVPLAVVQELRTYLVCGCNAHRAARELFLHRNTLVYHVELLEQLLGTGLEELPAPRKTLLEVSCLVALAAQPPTS